MRGVAPRGMWKMVVRRVEGILWAIAASDNMGVSMWLSLRGMELCRVGVD